MKKKSKFKLALQELENEISRIENENLFEVLGGYQGPGFDGSSTTYNVAYYLNSIGMTITTTDWETFYLDGVEIPDYSIIASGYDPEIDHSSGWGVVSHYISHFQNLGHKFNLVNGDYRYIDNELGSGYIDPSTIHIDPWKRDIQGNMIKTTTEEIHEIDYRPYSSGVDQVNIVLKKVIIKDSNNQDFIAYEVSGYTDVQGVFHEDVPSYYKQNCHGYAAGLDLWLFDYPTTAQNEVPASEANVITFYNGSVPAHSVRVDENGKIWSKSDTGIEMQYDSLLDFFMTSTSSGQNTYGSVYGGMTTKYYNIDRD